MRSSWEAIATKLSLSWSSWTVSSCSCARSIAIATRSETSCSSSTSSRVERARHECADVEHAERCAPDEQRDAEHRLDAFLAQDRVEDAGTSRRRGITGARPAATRPAKPRAERDANTLLDLLLDPQCRARDELVCRLVEQQDRAGVGVGGCRGCAGRRTESSSSTSRCASAASVTVCTFSIRSRACARPRRGARARSRSPRDRRRTGEADLRAREVPRTSVSRRAARRAPPPRRGAARRAST